MIGEIVADFAVPVRLRRRGFGATVKGRHAPAAPVESILSCVVTPASGNDLLRLPEARRNEETIRVFAQLPLSADKRAPDELVYRGAVWEVANVRDWSDQGSFCDALATRKAPQEGAAASVLGSVTHTGVGGVT